MILPIRRPSCSETEFAGADQVALLGTLGCKGVPMDTDGRQSGRAFYSIRFWIVFDWIRRACLFVCGLLGWIVVWLCAARAMRLEVIVHDDDDDEVIRDCVLLFLMMMFLFGVREQREPKNSKRIVC